MIAFDMQKQEGALKTGVLMSLEVSSCVAGIAEHIYTANIVMNTYN